MTEKKLRLVRSKKKVQKVECIMIEDGKNTHSSSPITAKKIDAAKLFYTKPLIGKRKLFAFFQDETQLQLETFDSKVSAKTLYLAERSQSLSKGLNEMFAQHFNMKKVLFFVGIGAVGVVLYYVFLGGGLG